MHLLARAIDAAVRVGKGVNRTRRTATLYAAIGEIEGAGRKVEKGIVTLARFGDEHGRRQPTLARLEAGIEAGIAAAVSFCGRQYFVVACDETYVGIDHRRSSSKRAHERVQAVIAIDSDEAKIGDDEPLCGNVAVALVPPFARGGGSKHINARLQFGHGLGDGEGSGHILIKPVRDRELAGIQSGPRPLLESIDVIGRNLSGKISALQCLGEAAVTDAIYLDADLVGVHGDKRDTLLASIGEYIAPRRGANGGRAILHVDRKLRGLG